MMTSVRENVTTLSLKHSRYDFRFGHDVLTTFQG
jgi:hypothetical protein